MSVILDGVPGTAMPPWRPLLSEADKRAIQELGIDSVVDLRSLDEREITPDTIDDETGQPKSVVRVTQNSDGTLETRPFSPDDAD